MIKELESLNTILSNPIPEMINIFNSLKKTYDEFVIALTMDMTVDLGLNMRDSLDDVFRKLKKQGIDIEGR